MNRGMSGGGGRGVNHRGGGLGKWNLFWEMWLIKDYLYWRRFARPAAVW